MTAQNRLWNKCAEIQRDFFRYCVLNGSYYLYFAPGEFKIVQQGFERDKPEGFEIAFPDRLPVHLDSRLFKRFLYDHLKSVPCLPVE